MDPLQDEENSSKRPRHDGSVEENDGSVLLTPKNAPPETNIIASIIEKAQKEGMWKQIQELKSKLARTEQDYFVNATRLSETRAICKANANLWRMLFNATAQLNGLEHSEDFVNDDSSPAVLASSLVEQLKRLDETSTEKLEKFISSMESSAVLLGRITSLETDHEELIQSKQRLEDTLVSIERKCRRLEIENSKTQPNARENNISPPSGPSVNTLDSKSSGHTDFSLLRIKGELEAAEKLAEMRLKDLETCEKARVEILIEKESLERRIADLPMEYLNNSSDIQSMQKEYTRLRKEVDDLKRSAEVISTRWEEQDAHLKDNLQKAELTMENRRREFLSTLDSIQSEASRLRKERDNMREAYERANSLVTANVRANGELQKNLEEVRSQVNVWKAKALRIKTLEEILTMLSNSEISIDSRSKEALDAIREIKEQESLIYGEIESLEKVFEGAQYTVERLTKQLSEKEEQISRLLGEKLRADFVVVQCKKDADIATQNATLLEKHALAQIEEFDKKNAEMRKKIEILESRLSQKTLEVEKLQHRMSEMRGEISQVQEKLKGISSKDHEKIIAEKTKISEAILFEKKRLEEEIERLRHQMRVVGLSSSPRTNNATFGAEKELQIYKKLMKCNSCHLRDKNAVITKCMHVFCKQCLDTRIETRQRKCPNCGEAFGTSDVRMIYL